MACAPSSLLGQSTPTLGEATTAGASALEGYLQQRELESRVDTGGVYRPYIAVFPFRDDSGFPADYWDLENDNARLLATLRELTDLGNTLIVVEHDEYTLRQADWIVDLGP